MKRIVAAALVLMMLLCMITVSASPGTIDDTLISFVHLDEKFAPALYAEIKQTLERAVNTAINRHLDAYGLGYDYAPQFTTITLGAEDAVALTMGTSFILLSGSATLTITSGTVVNISTGNVVTSGSHLVRYQRYFCTENTAAIVTTTSATSAQVDGLYRMDAQSQLPPALPFTDVAMNHWFFPAVEFAFNNELFLGTTDTTFSPQTSMTRAMFVTVLHRLDSRPSAGTDGWFADVSNPSLYYYEAVTWAHTHGIVTGFPDGTFRPNANVTREQMAVIMHRYAAYRREDVTASEAVFDTFSDRGRVSGFAIEAMQWATAREIIRGSNGNLLPRNTATRAEVAQIILNYCQNY